MGDERRHGRINALTDRGHGRHVLMNMLENKRHRIIESNGTLPVSISHAMMPTEYRSPCAVA